MTAPPCESTPDLQVNHRHLHYPEHLQSVGIELDVARETATISFANELPLGEGQLKLEFTGELNDMMKGCYRSKYTTPDGEERYGISTQFESTDCRRAFPCW